MPLDFTLTALVASLALALGIFNTFWSWKKDRTRLEIEGLAPRRVAYYGSTLRHGAGTAILVRNISNHDVTLSEVGFLDNTGMPLYCFSAARTEGPKPELLPYNLAPRTSVELSDVVDRDFWKESREHVAFVFANTQCGKQVKQKYNLPAKPIINPFPNGIVSPDPP